MKQYLVLLDDILKNGYERKDRTGTGTIGVFGRMLRFPMKDGFPLSTTKKLHLKSIIYELLWFLSGGTNIKYLNDNGVTIWDEWADLNKNLGPVYGYQWRNWRKISFIPAGATRFTQKNVCVEFEDGFKTRVEYIDQIANLIHTLKTNPDNRRMLVSAWNVSDLEEMRFPPCHYGFQVSTRELTPLEVVAQAQKDGIWIDEGDIDEIKNAQTKFKKRAISLLWNQRSVDVGLGLPFNIASYALLLMMIAQVVNMMPGDLICNLGDTHIYKNHIEQCKLQLERTPYQLPKMLLKDGHIDMDHWEYDDFKLTEYESHPHIKMDISI